MRRFLAFVAWLCLAASTDYCDHPAYIPDVKDNPLEMYFDSSSVGNTVAYSQELQCTLVRNSLTKR